MKSARLIAATAIVLLASTTSALAQDGSSSYPIGDDVRVLADSISIACPDGTPTFSYRLVRPATDAAASVTVTFVNPGGDDVVYADRKLEDTLLWPGAEIGADGTAVDWPGWQSVDGQWEQADDGYGFARGSVDVRFEVGGATTTVTATYPENCGPTPVDGDAPVDDDVEVIDEVADEDATEDSADDSTEAVAVDSNAGDGDATSVSVLGTSVGLPLTGVELALLIVVGAVLALAGAGALLFARRRQTV